MVHKLLLAKTVELGNTPININRRMGMVTLLHSSHYQALRSFITILHSTRHSVPNQPQAWANNIQVMGHRGKDMTSTKAVMGSLECFPSRSSHDKGRHLQVHRECLQDRRETIQSIGQHLPALHLHLDLLPAQLGDHQLASQRNHSCRLWSRGKQMSQGLQTCPHCRRFPTTNTMQMMGVTIRQTCAVQRVNPQSAWSKPNSPWSNLPTEWGRPTIVRSTSGRKYGWLGSSRKSISPSSRRRTDWNS